jgi:hypothetical protein
VPPDPAEAHAEAARDFIMVELVTKSDLALALENLKLSLTLRMGVIGAAIVGILVTIIELGS